MKHGTVVDIGSSKICLINASAASDGALIVHGAESRAYGGYRLGTLPSASSLEPAFDSAVKALEESTGLRLKSVTVGVPAPFVKTAITSLEVSVTGRGGKVSEQDLGYLLACAGDIGIPAGYELMHSTPFDHMLDGMPCAQPLGMNADRLSSSFCHAFADKRFMDLIIGVLDRLGLAAEAFVSTETAASAFSIPYEQRVSGAVLIDCGGTHTDVSAIRGNALLRTESIGIGGDHFTNDLSFGLRLPKSLAEELKRRYVFGLDYGDSAELVRIPHEGVFEIAHSTVQMIIEERAMELASYICSALDSVEGDLPIGAPVYLIGGGVAPLRGGAEYISRRTGRELLTNPPKTNRLSSERMMPALALAKFMLDGEGRGSRSRILANIKELFTAGAGRRRSYTNA